MSFDPRLQSAPPPALPRSTAAAILWEHYGLDGLLESQSGERDQNFLLHGTAGDRYVLKIANAEEPEAVTDFQIAALLHVESSSPAIRVPRIVRTTRGETSIRVSTDDGTEHTLRLLSWLPGIPLSDAAAAPHIAVRLGVSLAQLDSALQDFEHPCSDYPLIWDMKRVQNLRPLLESVDDGTEPLARVFDFVRGFASVTPLSAEEYDLLPALIAMRNVLTIVISSWRSALQPGNRDYLLRSQAKARHMIATLEQYRSAQLSRDLRRYCAG